MCLTLEQRAGILTPQYKNFGFPKLRVSSCKATPGHTLAHICVALVGLEVGENKAKFSGTLAVGIAIIICISSLPWTLVFFHQHL